MYKRTRFPTVRVCEDYLDALVHLTNFFLRLQHYTVPCPTSVPLFLRRALFDMGSLYPSKTGVCAARGKARTPCRAHPRVSPLSN